MTTGTGATLNNEIVAVFDERTTTSSEKVAALRALYEKQKKGWNHAHASTLMQRCAKAKIDVTKIVPLPALGALMSRSSHRKHLKAIEAAHALYGLRMLSNSTPDIGPFLTVLADLVLECNEEFEGKEMAAALFGLQRMSNDAPEVRRLLAILAVKFKLSKATVLSGADCSTAVFGLRRMSTTSDGGQLVNSADVLAIVEVLTEKIAACQDPLNAQSIGNMLNGLQGLASDQPVVVNLLRAVIPKVAQSQAELSALHIGSALMGLKSSTTEQEEVRILIALLAVKVNESPAQLDPISLSSAMNGLRNLRDDCLEVRALLSTLAEKISFMRERELEPRVVANALYGLRRMTGESPECRAVVAALAGKMGGSTVASGKTFSSLELGRALNGIQNMSVEVCPDVKLLLAKLADQVASAAEPLLPRDAGLAIAGLKAQTEETMEARALVAAVAAKLARQASQGPPEPMNSVSASMAMLGLQRMPSSCAEVRHLLTVLAPLVGGGSGTEADPLDAQACGNILFGMKKMTSAEPETRAFLAAVTPRIEAGTLLLGAQELANAYYGLCGMDSRYPEVRKILRVLNGKLAASAAHRPLRFTSQGIGNALSGLQSMAPEDGPEVLQALSLLTEQLEACEHVMPPVDLSNALFGLQGCVSEHEEVRAALIALTDKMRASDGIYNARDIGYSLAGLSAMQPPSCDEVRAITEELVVKVSRSPFQGQPNLLFLQFGKGVRVVSKRAASVFTMEQAELLSANRRK